jgi:hypothetical protein
MEAITVSVPVAVRGLQAAAAASKRALRRPTDCLSSPSNRILAFA